MNDLTGLVVCGGLSSRMQEDKSLLDYHGVSQREYMFSLLSEFCDDVFLSLNKDQSGNYTGNMPVITDEEEYSGSGPICSLLSFRKKYPGENVLCVGCDYPFVNAELLNFLIDRRESPAACFIHDDSNPEPLITIYETSMLKIIEIHFTKGNFSLSRILKEEGAVLIQPPSQKLIENVNTPDEYFLAKEYLKYKNILL